MDSPQPPQPFADFLPLAMARKSTYEFDTRRVSNADLNKMLEAARWAPSCTNTQPWHFVVVTDTKMIDKLTNLCTFGAFHTNPPVIIAVVLNRCTPKGTQHACNKGTGDDFITIGQASLNLIYQATTLGISTCYLSPQHGQSEPLLKIPHGMEVAVLVGVGYEKAGAFQKPHERKPLKGMVHYGKYGGKRFGF